MTLHKNSKKILVVFLSFFQIINVFIINATPLNNTADSNPIYNPAGTDKFYKNLPKTVLLSLDISPYYQSANGSRNRNGNKVPLGDMYGKWNMLSTFFDIDKMTPKSFSQTNYPNLWATNNALKNIGGIDYTNPENYHPEQLPPTDTTIPKPATFDNTSIYQVAGKYEKIGLRGKFGFDTSVGLGLSIKSGVADYKIRPRFVALAPNSDGTTVVPSDDPAKSFYYDLLQDSARNNIFSEVGLDVTEVRNTEMEDTHVQAYWSIPFHIKEGGEIVATIAPYLAAGGWLSSGNKKDYKKAFDVCTGNNGHSGITAEGSLNLDFPGTVQLSLGGGLLWLDEEDFETFRFPSNIYQSSFFPWTTSVKVDPGVTWYANLSFKSENFMSVMPGWAFFFDFIYAYHEHDEFTINEPSAQRNTRFQTGLEQMKQISSWKSQQVNFGITYDVAKHLTLGFIIQAPINGIKVYRSVTSMGTVSISF